MDANKHESGADWQSAVSADWQSAMHPRDAEPADCQSATQQAASLRYVGCGFGHRVHARLR
jgi:hypothetical protein